MKPLPILIALNAIAWALVVLLFVRQGSIESLSASPGADAPSSPAAAVGTSQLERFVRLQPGPGGEPASSLGMSPDEMDLFRKRVRAAQKLNAEEDRVLRIVKDIDRLVSERLIGQLSTEQKVKVAEIVVATNYELPGISRRIRERHDVTQMTVADRRQAMRAEYDRLRSDAQGKLEGVVSAADAKVIVDRMFRYPRARTPSPHGRPPGP